MPDRALEVLGVERREDLRAGERPQRPESGAQVVVRAAVWAPDSGGRCVGGDEAGREHPTGGEGHVLAEDDEHRGLEGVGAAGHAQVRPGPHERPEHRVVGERGDALRRGPRPGPTHRRPAATADGTASGRPSASTTGVPTSPAGTVTVSTACPPSTGTSRRCRRRPVGQHLDVVETRHGVRHEERPQCPQVDERWSSPGDQTASSTWRALDTCSNVT